MRDLATNQALLEALMARRATLAQSAATPESKRHGLEFLDMQIEKMKREIAE
jgi:hypothetical protein